MILMNAPNGVVLSHGEQRRIVGANVSAAARASASPAIAAIVGGRVIRLSRGR